MKTLPCSSSSAALLSLKDQEQRRGNALNISNSVITPMSRSGVLRTPFWTNASSALR